MGWKDLANAFKSSLTGTPPLPPAPPILPPPDPANPPAFVQFVDPTFGSFTVDIPQGWQARGGLARPGLGDRRAWIELFSPEGIHILAGDPEFPQSLIHSAMQFEGSMVPLAAGGLFRNVKPDAEHLIGQYLKVVGPARFGQITMLRRGARPDLVAVQAAAIQQAFGTVITPDQHLTASEYQFQIATPAGPKIGSIAANTFVDKRQSMMGLGTFWNGITNVYLAPPALDGLADFVRRRMMASFRNTPQMFAIHQQDEAMITANGQMAHAAQMQWFQGQQMAHRAQESIGNIITSGYWSQQHINDRMLRGWEHNQAVNDRLSQARSDAMLGNQRLADDSMNTTYDAPAGHDYYWLDQQTGQVIGTNSSEPPDYSRNYTQLRKQ